MVGPLKDYPLGLLDLKTKEVRTLIKRITADVYDDVVVSEGLDGQLALYRRGQSQPIAVVRLPEARLGRLRAAAVSPDLDWLAISNRSRGSLWNLPRNERTQNVRSFAGAWFSPQGVLYADFPRSLKTERMIATINLTGAALTENYRLGDDTVARQEGGFLLVTMPKGKSRNSDCDVEIRDIADNKLIWARHFVHEVPNITLNAEAGTVLLAWRLSEAGGNEELQNFPDLKNRASRRDYLYEVLHLRDSSIVGKVLVKTNNSSIVLQGGVSDGDWIIATAAGNQILTFSLSSGAEKEHFFGVAPLLVSRAGLLALERDAKELEIYDLNTQQLQRRYIFADPIAWKRISADGKRLLVLTNAQNVYLFDTNFSN
ncbi:MAG: hypothetical protein ACM3WP_22695 [Acidobacteriota bacterium]